MTTAPNILVAGIGNIFFGDDAFGTEVARRLLQRPQLPNVRVVDFGIRGLDLVYALLDGCDVAILIDAVPRDGQQPGTLFLLEPEIEATDAASGTQLEAHAMDPMQVLQSAVAMGAKPGRVLIVGCQPESMDLGAEGSFDEPIEMSAAVAGAIDAAVTMVEALVDKITHDGIHEISTHTKQEVMS